MKGFVSIPIRIRTYHLLTQYSYGSYLETVVIGEENIRGDTKDGTYG